MVKGLRTRCGITIDELKWDDENKRVLMSGNVSDKCYAYFETEPGYLTILNNNGGKESIVAKSNPTFSSVSTTNQGMYATLNPINPDNARTFRITAAAGTELAGPYS